MKVHKGLPVGPKRRIVSWFRKSKQEAAYFLFEVVRFHGGGGCRGFKCFKQLCVNSGI
jgi:hypothetical protein